MSGIHTQRNRIAGLASAIPAASPIALPLQHQLSDLVLASESENLKPSQQSSVIRNTGAALNAQLSQVSVSGDQSITLTSRNASIPVSIASRAPYPITGTLTLTSDKLLFANGTRRLSMQVPLTSANTTRYIAVQARSSGESKLQITFSTPADGMVITTGVHHRPVHRHLGGRGGALPRSGGGAVGLVAAHQCPAAETAEDRSRRGPLVTDTELGGIPEGPGLPAEDSKGLAGATVGMAIGTTLSRITGVGRLIALAVALGQFALRRRLQPGQHHPQHHHRHRDRGGPVGHLRPGVRRPAGHPPDPGGLARPSPR